MLGVLGGMGPMATVDFMSKIINNSKAICDQDHIEMIVLSASGIPDRTNAIMSNGEDPFVAMLSALRRLEAAGATIIAIPCNTAHNWHSKLQAETSVNILHIVDAVASQIPEHIEKKLGILAGTGAIKQKIYQNRLRDYGFIFECPDDNDQEELMMSIRLVKSGKISEAKSIIEKQTFKLLEKGCSRVVMACTELPIALPITDDHLGFHLVDATNALAIACVDAYAASNTIQLRYAAA